MVRGMAEAAAVTVFEKSYFCRYDFETFADAFSHLENSSKFLLILSILLNHRIEKNFQGAKKHLPRFLLGN